MPRDKSRSRCQSGNMEVSLQKHSHHHKNLIHHFKRKPHHHKHKMHHHKHSMNHHKHSPNHHNHSFDHHKHSNHHHKHSFHHHKHTFCHWKHSSHSRRPCRGFIGESHRNGFDFNTNIQEDHQLLHYIHGQSSRPAPIRSRSYSPGPSSDSARLMLSNLCITSRPGSVRSRSSSVINLDGCSGQSRK